MIPVYVFTSDKYLWALRVMLHLYQKHWNWPLTVFGFSAPSYKLPECATFRSMGNFADYPAGRWSDAVIGAIQSTGARRAVVLLEDYWLTRRVNLSAITALGAYMGYNPDVARVDLTSDRQYAGDLVELGPWQDLDIIGNDPPGQYVMSTQAAIWDLPALYRDILNPGESAWQAELNGTARMVEKKWRAVGTRQCPVRYIIGVQQGQLTLDGGYQVPCPKWGPGDLQDVENMLAEDGKL